MRILAINASDITGGSAITGYRLCKSLERLFDSVEAFFVVGQKGSKDPKVFCTKKNLKQHYFERNIDKYTNKLGLQYFWFPFSSRMLLNLARELKPDIFYLRNIHGGYFDTSLIKRLSKYAPIVWTLSDMWSFTGNCIYSYENMAWKYMESGCSDIHSYPAIGMDTGKWLLKRKKKIYQDSTFTVVTPSKWLYNLAIQSPVFDGKEIIQIYNGFDLDVFKPKDKASCRVALNIPTDSKVMIFSAQFLNDPRKGGNDLIRILQSINQKTDEKIHLLVVGDRDLEDLYTFEKFVVHNIGYINNDILMATCYAASDVLLYPTKADNLSNVLLEAISCGTPCITYDVGGCGEIIENGINGFTIRSDDTVFFAFKVMEILESDQKQNIFSANARKSAEKKFTLEKMCNNYYNLFQKTIADHQK
jgi:glycosyltransferase involved in cell wall biosynthesis